MNAVVRDAARAVVLDPDGRVLLVRFVNPETGEDLWTTPGGGVDPDESFEEAIRRELREETGLENAELGPVVWIRREVFPWVGRTLDQRERFVLVRAPAFEPRPQLGRERLAAEHVHEVRWWTLAELERAGEAFAPRRLPQLYRALLAEGPPPEPVDVGV